MSTQLDGQYLQLFAATCAYEAPCPIPQGEPILGGNSRDNIDTNTRSSISSDSDTNFVYRTRRHSNASSIRAGSLSSRLGSIYDDGHESLGSLRHATISSNSSLHSSSTRTSSSENRLEEHPNTPPLGRESPSDHYRSWLPLYLRRPVLITFTGLFGAMIVALEAMLAVSKKRQGLTESHTGLRYLWTYGPTALLTFLRAFWNRVDYEAKTTAPWVSANPVCTSRDALLLDYVDMFPLVVPFRALRRQDYMVAASATVSHLLTVLIALSTGLLTLSPVEVFDTSVPISLKSQFVDNPAGLVNTSALPFYGIRGLLKDNLTYPSGCSDQFAYQPFTSTVPGISKLYATVEGMSLGLDCEQAAVIGPLHQHTIWSANSSSTFSSITIGLEYEACNFTLEVDIFFSTFPSPNEPFSNMTNTVFRRNYVHLELVEGLALGQCGSKDIDYKRLVFVAAEIQYKLVKETEAGYEYQADIAQSSSVVCAPNYGITPVDVVRDAKGVISVSQSRHESPRTFPDIHPWDIIQAHNDSIAGLQLPELAANSLSGINLDATFDYYSGLVLSTCGDACSQFSHLLNATVLENILVGYHRKYAAFLFQQYLMGPVDIESTAAASRIAERLLVQPMDCQLMGGLMTLIIMILVGVLLIPPRTMPRSMEPGSILATAALAGRFTSSRFPRSLGAADAKTMVSRIGSWSRKSLDESYTEVTGPPTQSNFLHKPPSEQKFNDTTSLTDSHESIYPFVLRPAFRITISFLIIGCVVALEVTLQKSLQHQGLGDVQDETYIHYVWTVVPAAVLSLLALFFSSTDFQTRLLAPYVALTRVARASHSLELGLLRHLAPWALYQELKTRSFAVFATSIVALIASMFTISGGSLYRLETFPSFRPIALHTTSTLVAPRVGWTASYAASLILESNLSYSPLAYENLVFPGLSLEEYTTTNASQASQASSVIMNVTIPAFRPQLSCHWYAASDITTGFFYNQEMFNSTQNRTHNGLSINITGETCPWEVCSGRLSESTSNESRLPNDTATFEMDLPTEGFFATATCTATHAVLGYSKFLYTWGNYSSLSDPSFITASALGCNATTELVDVVVSLRGPQLQLDLTRPPRPIESTSRPVEIHVHNERLPNITDIDSAFLYESIVHKYVVAPLASLPVRSNDTTIIFDNFFKQLVTSRYAIPISTIGDRSQAEIVKEAILFQHGIIAAQYYSKHYRMDVETPLNGTSGDGDTYFPTISSASPSTGGDTGVYRGTATDPYGKRRVVQDPASTRVVEALLLTTLALSLLGWLLGPRNAVLPRSPTSIASVLALLAGGDVLEHLYRGDANGDAQGGWESLEDAKLALPPDCKFWMGWGPPPASGRAPDEEDNKGRRRFGIWVLRDRGEETETLDDRTAGSESSARRHTV